MTFKEGNFIKLVETNTMNMFYKPFVGNIFKIQKVRKPTSKIVYESKLITRPKDKTLHEHLDKSFYIATEHAEAIDPKSYKSLEVLYGER